jgi:hypothetical protein
MSTTVMSRRGPVTLGSFKEVIRLEGRYINDHCIVRHDNRFHFFGIVGPVGSGCHDADSEISFAHVSSDDLCTWEIHDDVMRVAGQWPEINNVWSPNVIRHDNRFYMLYAALDGRKQRLCLATSDDLFAWKRFAHNPVIVPSLSWSKWPGFDMPSEANGNCRDAHILRLENGTYVVYWVGEMQERFGTDITCVAASVSSDLIHFQEIGPVFWMKAWDIPPETRAVESPCVVYTDNRYWLFFKHGWWTHCVVSDNPLDFRGGEPVRMWYSHASEIFHWNSRWWITHCSGDPQEYRYYETNRTRGLYIGNLSWEPGSYPVIE